MPTYQQVKKEAIRRAIEDFEPRIVYLTTGASLAIGLIADDLSRNPFDDPIAVAWPDGSIEEFSNQTETRKKC